MKVGGAEYLIARKARENFMTTPTLCQTTLHDQGCCHKFLSEKMNFKSSGIDLAAIEAHLLMIRPGKCLEI